MKGSFASSPALAPVARFLAAPDAPGDGSPLEPAAALATGMVGTALFGGALAWAVGSGGLSGEGSGMSLLPAFLVGVPLAQLLCFPPLFLWTTLRGATVPPLKLATVAAAGPGALGAWLGATAPVFLLYSLSGPVAEGRWESLPAIAVGLLGLGAAAAGLFVGARNAVRAGRHAGAGMPGAMALLSHYAFVLWTTAILVARLAG